MTGNLSYQIEHHLFPDLPSSRYAEVALRVRALCERYGLPYVSGPLPKQYAQVLRKILGCRSPAVASRRWLRRFRHYGAASRTRPATGSGALGYTAALAMENDRSGGEQRQPPYPRSETRAHARHLV